MKQTFLALIMFLFLIPSIAQSAAYYAPNQRIFSQYENRSGNSFEELVKIKKQAYEEVERQGLSETELTKLRNMLSDTARSEANIWADYASKNGAAQAVNKICRLIRESGNIYRENFHDGIQYISYFYKEIQNGPEIQYDYAFNTKISDCFVRVSIPDFNIQAYASSIYSEPQKSIAVIVGEYMGIILSELPTEKGGLKVLTLIPGGIAESAGLKVGDELIKVDSYDLRKENRDRVAAYFALRYQQKANIKGTFLRPGKEIVLSLKLGEF